MSRFSQAMRKLQRDLTLSRTPSSILFEYRFRIDSDVPPVRGIGDRIFFKWRCVVKLEVNTLDQIRATFVGAARADVDASEDSTDGPFEIRRSDITPWYDYEDRLCLAAIIATRLKQKL
jgi:hypothetical protein